MFLFNVARAQQPTAPAIVVQPANSSPPAPIATSAAQDSTALRSALKSLQEVKAANGETLKKQEAVLEQLDEMQKAAQQLKIFSHRTGG